MRMEAVKGRGGAHMGGERDLNVVPARNFGKILGIGRFILLLGSN